MKCKITFIVLIAFFRCYDLIAQLTPVQRWGQVAAHLSHKEDLGGQFGFGTALSEKKTLSIGPVDLSKSETERFYGTRSTGKFPSITVKAYSIEGKWRVDGKLEGSAGLDFDAVDLAFKAAATAAVPLGPQAVALVLAIQKNIPKSVKDAIKITAEFGIDVGKTSRNTPYLRIFTGGGLKLGSVPLPGGLKFKGGGKAIHSWQVYQRQHLQELGIPGADFFTFLQASSGDEIYGSGEPDAVVYIDEEINADGTPFTNNYSLFTDNQTPVTFTTQGSPFYAIPEFAVKESSKYMFGDYKIGNHAFDIYRLYSALGLLSGVDLSGLSIAGLDVDNVSKTINFIFKGESNGTTSTTTLSEESAYLKKIFLQALVIPNTHQWVSLDRVAQGSNTVGMANADNTFKNTEFCQALFKADAQMKYELYQEMLQLGDTKGIFNLWLSIFRDTDTGMYNNLVAKGMAFPNIFMRGLILPASPKGNKDSKLFLEDVKYELKYFVDNIDYSSFANVSLPVSEYLYFYDRQTEFESILYQTLAEAAKRVEKRIDEGKHPDYLPIKRILPAVVAAHWYKAQYINKPDALFYNLIDSHNLDTNIGYGNLRSAAPFDQNFWNASADRILGYETFTDGGKTYTVQVRGGIDHQNTKTGSLSVGLVNTQQSILNNVKNNYSHQTNGKTFIYGGGAPVKMPEFSIGYLEQKHAVDISATNEVSDTENDFTVNVPSKISLNLINSGNLSASSVAVSLYEIDASVTPSAIRFIAGSYESINKLSQKEIVYNYTPASSGIKKLVGYINVNTENFINTPLPELIATNNLFENEVFVKPQGPRAVIFPAQEGVKYGNEAVELYSFSYDPLNLPLTYQWSSNLQGVLGIASSLTMPSIQKGRHAITLTVKNTNGQSSSNTVNIEFSECPTDTLDLSNELTAETGKIMAGHIKCRSTYENSDITLKCISGVLSSGFHAKPGSNIHMVSQAACNGTSSVTARLATNAPVSENSNANSVVYSAVWVKRPITIADRPAIFTPQRTISISSEFDEYKLQLFNTEEPVKKSNVKEAVATDEEFSVFPNPFSDELLIKSNAKLKEIEFITPQGQKIGNNFSYTQSGTNEWKINTAPLPQGLYILTCRFNDSSPRTQKVIKK